MPEQTRKIASERPSRVHPPLRDAVQENSVMVPCDSYIRYLFCFQVFHVIFFKSFSLGHEAKCIRASSVPQPKRTLKICNPQQGGIHGQILPVICMMHFCTRDNATLEP